MTKPATFKVFHIPFGMNLNGWYYKFEYGESVGPFNTSSDAKREAKVVLRRDHTMPSAAETKVFPVGGCQIDDPNDSDAAYRARQRHQRDEEGDIPDPRAGG